MRPRPGTPALEVDLFNVLNGLSSSWGRLHTVSGSSRNLMEPRGYDAESNEIRYSVPTGFGTPTQFSGLLMQFQVQVGIRYRF
jgi:hypothetical protein